MWIRQKIVLVLMAIACHAGENTHAAFSTLLQGVAYVGATYGKS
jgi:hypothetical protein